MSQTTLPANKPDSREADRFLWWPFAGAIAAPVLLSLSGAYYHDVAGHLVPWHDVLLTIAIFLMMFVALGLSISMLIKRRWRTALSMAAPLIIVPAGVMLNWQTHDHVRWHIQRSHYVARLSPVLAVPDQIPVIAWALGDSWEQWLEYHEQDHVKKHPHEWHEQERRLDKTGCEESFKRLEARYYLHKYVCGR
jgi:hypothetical protein